MASAVIVIVLWFVPYAYRDDYYWAIEMSELSILIWTICRVNLKRIQLQTIQ